MARRRDDDILTTVYRILLITPWWVGPVLAGLAFAFFYWVIPVTLQGDSFLVPALRPVCEVAAPVSAGLVLLAWALSLVTKRRRAKLLDTQRNLESLREISWQDFENLVGEYFRRRGYTVTQQGGAGADGGVDLELHRGGRRWLVQCKHWRSRSVGVEAVRAFYGVVTADAAAGGFFVTTGNFTAAAVEFCKRRVELIDGKQLWAGVSELRAGGAGALSTAEPEPVEAGVPAIEGAKAENVPACPACGKSMVLRTAKRGSAAGSKFFGCSNFPRCRGTRPV